MTYENIYLVFTLFFDFAENKYKKSLNTRKGIFFVDFHRKIFFVKFYSEKSDPLNSRMLPDLARVWSTQKTSVQQMLQFNFFVLNWRIWRVEVSPRSSIEKNECA